MNRWTGAVLHRLPRRDVVPVHSLAQPRMSFEVNSVPLSDTIVCGLPRAPISAVNARATRLPEIEG
jgi:hypothetical protein